ncbi:TlpA family protein disulfide reductase [Pedobacter jamesrossensis]|uniref:TlpA family protein disulfide reductase n=1 Tax=Pedobacter jamesrossensis TaxID=1908238 RepID=A0ABV8NSU5_9SPHI
MKVFLFLFILFYSSFSKAQNAPVKWASQETFFEELTGKQLPDFKGISTNNKPFSSSILKGRIVVINFWFEACPPCVKEIPELNKLVKKYGKNDIRFIAITYDLPEQAKKFQKKSGYKYEIVSLTDDQIRKLNINHGFPSNILVGKDGRIIKAISAVSFDDEIPSVQRQTLIFEEKLKAEINKTFK